MNASIPIVYPVRVERAHVGLARARLRSATAATHERLHRHPGFFGLLHGSLTIAEYSSLLARLYGFHWPLERVFRMIPGNMRGRIDLRAREKAHLLYADLIAVGMSASEIDALPLCSNLSQIHTEEALFGCLYVVEGAGLGGSMMARNLDFLLGAEVSSGRQFFLGRKSADPLPWAAYCELLEICAAEGNLDDIIDGARKTFDSFELWLNEGCDNG
jgi:heme oxygenase